MWINSNTGKGWTDAEEVTFADIMRIGHLTRIKANQLWARCKHNTEKALALAAEYGKVAEANEPRAANLKRFRGGRLLVQKVTA